MADSLSAFFRSFQPTYFYFVSGVFVSLGMNLLATILGSDALPRRWVWLTVASAFAVASSAFWSLVAWHHDAARRLWAEDATRRDSTVVWTAIYSRVGRRLVVQLSSALALGAAAIGCLVLSRLST